MTLSQSTSLDPQVVTHQTKKSQSKNVMHFVPVKNKHSLRVFCLPHAGSGAAAFKAMTSSFFDGYEMMVAQYPGRENRLGEERHEDLHKLVDEFLNELLPYAQDPYVLFGHSMGSKVAFELVQRLQAQGARLPDKLVVSCGPAPHLPSGLNPAFQEADDVFLDYLQRLGGVPSELLKYQEILDLVLPVLRSDFGMLYRYQASEDMQKIQCPVHAIGSPQDLSVNEAAMKEWQQLCAGDFSYHRIEGGHFYFSKTQKQLSDVLAL